MGSSRLQEQGKERKGLGLQLSGVSFGFTLACLLGRWHDLFLQFPLIATEVMKDLSFGKDPLLGHKNKKEL